MGDRYALESIAKSSGAFKHALAAKRSVEAGITSDDAVEAFAFVAEANEDIKNAKDDLGDAEDAYNKADKYESERLKDADRALDLAGTAVLTAEAYVKTNSNLALGKKVKETIDTGKKAVDKGIQFFTGGPTIVGGITVKDEAVAERLGEIGEQLGAIESSTQSIRDENKAIKDAAEDTKDNTEDAKNQAKSALIKECVLDVAARTAARELANKISREYLELVIDGAGIYALTQDNPEQFWGKYRINEVQRVLNEDRFGSLCLPGIGIDGILPRIGIPDLHVRARNFLSARGWVDSGFGLLEPTDWCSNVDLLERIGLGTATPQEKIDFLSTHGNIWSQSAEKNFDIAQLVRRVDQKVELLSNSDNPDIVASFAAEEEGDEEGVVSAECDDADRGVDGLCPVIIRRSSGAISNRLEKIIDEPFSELKEVDEFSELFVAVAEKASTNIIKKISYRGSW